MSTAAATSASPAAHRSNTTPGSTTTATSPVSSTMSSTTSSSASHGISIHPAPSTYSSSDQARNTFLSLLSGGIAGAVSRTATAPLERLKVMKQVDHKGEYRGVLASLARMYREEGLLSYWKGNGTNVIRIAPQSAIQFFSFDVYKRLLIGNYENEEKQHIALTLTAGALAGSTATFVCYPLDLVRSFLSVQTTSKEYKGIVHTLKTIVQHDGFLGLYRGILPTLAGISPYVAINFTVFNSLRIRYMPSRDHPHYNLINLSLGACAGFVSAGITYPTDTLRRRMQLQGMKGFNIPRYKNSWECIKFTVRDEGITGMYKGMIPCWLKVVPSTAIAFMTYEFLRKQLKFDPPKSKPPSAG